MVEEGRHQVEGVLLTHVIDIEGHYRWHAIHQRLGRYVDAGLVDDEVRGIGIIRHRGH